MKHRLASYLVLIPTLFLSGCNGSSNRAETSGSGAVDASSMSNINDTFNAIEGLLDSIDAETANSRLSPRFQVDDPQPGSFSKLGCHYQKDRERTFKQLDRIRTPLCAIQKVEGYSPEFSLPEDGSYLYFQMILPDEPESGEDQSMRMRIRRRRDSNGRFMIDYQMCEPEVSEEWVQHEYFEVAEISGGIEAFAANEFRGTDPQGQTFHGASSFLIKALGETSEDLEQVVLEAVFQDGWGCGNVSVEADRTLPRNTLLGFSEGGGIEYSHAVGICVYAARGKGSGHVKGWGTFPPLTDSDNEDPFCPDPVDHTNQIPPNEDGFCLDPFDHAEDFRKAEENGEIVPVVDGNPDSTLQSLVSNCHVPETCPNPEGFREDWNCEAPTGEAFLGVNLGEIPGFRDCLNSERDVDFDTCEEKVHEEESADTTQ